MGTNKYTCQVWDSRTQAFTVVDVTIPARTGGRNPSEQEDTTADEIQQAVSYKLGEDINPWFVVGKHELIKTAPAFHTVAGGQGVMAQILLRVLTIELREVRGDISIITAIEID